MKAVKRERDLYLFYIPYKVYIDIVSVLRCVVNV